MDTTTPADTQPQPQQERPAPKHGEHAADLIFDTEASPLYGGAWIYPACYDDYHLARRRAHSLERGFGIPFAVDLLGVVGEPWSIASVSIAVSMPGYYAYTLHDPRPHLIVLDSEAFWNSEHRIASINPISRSQQANERSGEEGDDSDDATDDEEAEEAEEAEMDEIYAWHNWAGRVLDARRSQQASESSGEEGDE